MKYICIGMLFVFTSLPVIAQKSMYKPFTSFKVIKTEHFDIVFPKESESSAYLLASYADRVYNQVTSLLDIRVRSRIAVTFVPHTQMFNGYYSPPLNHIVLYDTPMNVEWTNFANNLESLFLHELTHAVSLNSKSKFYNFLYSIFGNIAIPTSITAPAFMVEGVTVSFESLSGYGRANDPLIKQYLRQAVYEDKFLTAFQASGLYDRSMQPAGYHYDYGGLFSTWLIKTYGMEKYASLWQNMGSLKYMSVIVYRSGFYRIFKNVYNTEFLKAWDDFKSTFVINNLETNTNELLPKKYRYFNEKSIFYDDVVSKENKLYFIDKTNNRIGIYDAITEEIRYVNAGNLAYNVDVSSDGSVFLLSGYRYVEDRYFSTVTEYKTNNGGKTGLSIDNLYSASYFRNGVIGLRSDLHNNCIVYNDLNGNTEILFQGNETLMFSGPKALDNEKIVFIALLNGRRELWLYNYISHELYKIENCDDNDYWLYMRNLSVSKGKLLFSHNENDKMYKLACIDLDTMQAVFSSRDFSGGVFNPVLIGDNIYYRGAFVFGDSILQFPETVNTVSGSLSDIKLTKLNLSTFNKELFDDSKPASFENIGLKANTMKTKADENELLIENNLSGNEMKSIEYSSKRYLSLLYFNPFKFWLPAPLIRVHETNDKIGIKFDGAGLFSIMADPTDRNFITVLAYWDFFYRMAVVDRLTWQNTAMGFPLSVSFSDNIYTVTSETPFRITNVSLSGQINWNLEQSGFGILAGIDYGRSVQDNGELSAYKWNEAKNIFYYQFIFSYTYRRLLNVYISGDSIINEFLPRLNGVIRLNVDARFPMYFAVFGIYDTNKMNLHGVSGLYGSTSISNYVLTEYENPSGFNISWLAGAEASIGLFSFEIQGNISHLYFNRVYGSLALRNQIYDSKGIANAEGLPMGDLRLLQSLRLKIGIKTSYFPLVKQVFTYEPYALFAWKFSNTIMGNKNGFFWNIVYGIDFSIL